MKTIKFLKLALLFVAITGLLSFSPKSENMKPKPVAKYVFLFIGDGMGINHILITNEYLKMHGKAALSFTKLPYFALTTTNCIDSMRITDSAAAGTAIATGKKTKSGVLGMLPTTGEKFISIAEIAKQNNMKVGILSSVGMNHATPAAFYAKQKSRSMYKEIAEDMALSQFDLFAGGGLYAADQTELQYLLNNLKSNNYNFIFNETQFNKKEHSNKKIYYSVNADKIPGYAIPYRIDQKENDVVLADYVRFGIDYLENPNGFFMMAEGGKIDWSSHDNDGATTVQEVIDFDLAVQEALKFYEKHPDETLIVITADHETGGFSYGSREMAYKTDFLKIDNQKMSEEVFAEELTENKTETANKLVAKNFSLILKDDYFKTTSSKEISNQVTDSLNRSAGIWWTTGAHTGTAVLTYAIGVGSSQFTGFIDNTDIIKFIKKSAVIEIKQ